MDLENFYVSFTLKHWSSLFTIPRMDLVYIWYEDIYGPKFYTVPPPPPTQPQDFNCYINVFRTTLLVSLGQVTDLKLLEFFVMLLTQPNLGQVTDLKLLEFFVMLLTQPNSVISGILTWDLMPVRNANCSAMWMLR